MYRYTRASVEYTKHAHTSRNLIVGDGRAQSQFGGLLPYCATRRSCSSRPMGQASRQIRHS